MRCIREAAKTRLGRRDLPGAVDLFDSGHFALEEETPRIAALIDAFIARIATQYAGTMPYDTGRSGQAA